MRLHEIVARAAGRAPDRTAVADEAGALTFAELEASAGALAGALRSVPTGGAEGPAPGARVAVVADNCVGFLQLSYAASAAGMVLAPLNPRATAAEHVALVEDAAATVLAGHAGYLAPLAEARAAGRMPSVSALLPLPERGVGPLRPDPLPAGPAPAPHRRAGGPGSGGWAPHPDLAWLLFTSGTTGKAKGVQLTHHGLLAAARATLEARPVTGDDVFLTCFSLCHVAAYNVLVAHLAACPVVLRPRFVAAELPDVVSRHRVTMASLAPTMLSSLLAHLDAHPEDRRRLATLRAVAYGSSGIGAGLLRRTLAELGLDLYQGYGMTEGSGNMAFLGPDEHRRAASDAPWLLASCGRPSPAVEVAVVDPSGAGLPAGQAGEIVLRGPQVTPGYWGGDAAGAGPGPDGWFRTGDIGRFDADGYLYIVDRAKDIVVSGGENISSRQVEDALAALPGVQAVAVVGVPDDHWGEAVCACVEVAAGAEEAAVEPDALRQASRAHLPRYAVPKHVLVVDALPRNSTGKVVKPDLRAWAAGAVAAAQGEGPGADAGPPAG